MQESEIQIELEANEQETEIQIEPETNEQEQEIDVEPEEFVVNINFDYDTSKNKPRINDHELMGNKTADDLDLQAKMTSLSNMEIDKIMEG